MNARKQEFRGDIYMAWCVRNKRKKKKRETNVYKVKDDIGHHFGW